MPDRLALPQRRHALRLGLINAMIWSMGYAMTTGALVVYLAIDLGATGKALSFLLAAPSLAGLLRLLAPAIIARAGGTKRTCVGAFALAFVVLMGLPLTGVIAPQMSRGSAIGLLIVVMCTYQLLEFVGFVAYWSWFAELVPLRVRGNYFGWRQSLQIAVIIPTALAAGYFSDHWREAYKDQRGMMLLGYAIPNALGTACMLGSLIPLVLIPAAGTAPAATGIPWRAMAAPFRQWRFRRLLSFRAGLALANGISQTAEKAFPKNVLKLGVWDLAIMKNVMQVGQLGTARVVGPVSDRYGNRPVLVACQWLVSAAMVFYLIAAPEPRWMAWLILGAWILWSAYAGHNICLPNLALKLAPDREKSPYVAAHEALGSVCHAAATIGGGFLFDWLANSKAMERLGLAQLNPYVAMFALALVARLLAVPLAAAIEEPGAWSWGEILRGRFAAGRRPAASASE